MSRYYEQLECGCLVSCNYSGGGLIPGCDGKDCKVQEYMKEHDIKYGYCKICNPEEYKVAIEIFGDYTEVGENEIK